MPFARHYHNKGKQIQERIHDFQVAGRNYFWTVCRYAGIISISWITFVLWKYITNANIHIAFNSQRKTTWTVCPNAKESLLLFNLMKRIFLHSKARYIKLFMKILRMISCIRKDLSIHILLLQIGIFWISELTNRRTFFLVHLVNGSSCIIDVDKACYRKSFILEVMGGVGGGAYALHAVQ